MNYGIVIGAAVLVVAGVLFLPIIPVHSQVSSISMTWTATGDDDSVGTAAKYEMRFSTIRPDTTNADSMITWWRMATDVPNMPAPYPSGQAMTVLVTPQGGFVTGRTYYFVLRAIDDAGNISDYSNVAVVYLSDTIPPRAVIDLRRK